MIAESKVQNYGRMQGKGKIAGVGAGKNCDIFQGIIQT